MLSCHGLNKKWKMAEVRGQYRLELSSAGVGSRVETFTKALRQERSRRHLDFITAKRAKRSTTHTIWFSWCLPLP